MEILEDTQPINKNVNYDTFEVHQLIAKLLIGEKLEIFVDGIKIKEYIAKYINCHFNLQFQDKGVKRDPTELEKLQVQKEQLDLEIAKLQGT